MKSLFIFFILVSSSFAKDYILPEWKTCKTDQQCQLVHDSGCSHQCKKEIINLRYQKSLRDKINKECADVLMPIASCPKDFRVKIPRCIEGKCQIMTKHICCRSKDAKLRKERGCHIKKVSCKEVKL